jgi:hypothetical protein
VSSGTLLTVSGVFFSGPFAIKALQSPSLEVPLASVKIANRQPEQQRPENEPFGQSGTRCALFDPGLEEPYGVFGDGGNLVTKFFCKISGPREAGRYNLSVALLGQAMMPDYLMNMGESRVDDVLYVSDHHGRSFMLQHIGLITDYSPRSTGLMGGTLLTIYGDGFTNNASILTISIAGTPCSVLSTSLQRIVCKIQAFRY